MKNETKIKIAAVSAGFALATLIGTLILIGLAHPAQWYVAGGFITAFGITLFITASIDC